MIKKITLSLLTFVALAGQTVWAQDDIEEPFLAHDFQAGELFFKKTTPTSTEVFVAPQYEAETEEEAGYDAETIPQGVVKIPATVVHKGTTYTIVGVAENAFRNCTGITQVSLPEGVRTLQTGAFQNTGLTSIMFPSTLREIKESVFSQCGALTEVTIPKTITEISENLFDECRALVKVQLPSTITRIGSFAFRRCTALTSFTIPAAVVGMGTDVFADNDNLKQVTCEFSNPEQVKFTGFIGGIFYRVSVKEMTLIVPAGTKESFAALSPWKDFGKIEESTTTGIAAPRTALASVTGSKGAVTLALPAATSVQVYAMSGALVQSLSLSAGLHTLTLSQGTYLVQVGRQVVKVVVS